jgi:hypothetical protein
MTGAFAPRLNDAGIGAVHARERERADWGGDIETNDNLGERR